MVSSVHVVGQIDVVENNSLIAGCRPSYSSLSIAEINCMGKITPLDIMTTEYESSISSCCFNDTSSQICLSTIDCKNYIWDLQTHTDVHSFHSAQPLFEIQRYINENTWIARENKGLVIIDSRDNRLSPISSFSDSTSFSLSSDKR